MDEQIGKMDVQTFEQTLFSFIDRGFDQMNANTFFEALALADEKASEEVKETESSSGGC
jgi:hypothetical protein